MSRRPRINMPHGTIAERGLLALDVAILAAGGQANLAERLGITTGQVSQWKTREHRVPIHYVPSICRAVKHPKVSPYTLRPDLADDWMTLSQFLKLCDDGHARTSALDAWEVQSERENIGPIRRQRGIGRRTLARISALGADRKALA